jgi:hypothetical protein
LVGPPWYLPEKVSRFQGFRVPEFWVPEFWVPEFWVPEFWVPEFQEFESSRARGFATLNEKPAREPWNLEPWRNSENLSNSRTFDPSKPSPQNPQNPQNPRTKNQEPRTKNQEPRTLEP